MGVEIRGIGFCGAFPTSTSMSYREMIARAARMAYEEAGVSAEDIEGAVIAEEDFITGYSITDEYSPDQLGVVKKSVYTVSGDFIQALGSAVMQIRSGAFKLLVVSAYSKVSNLLTKEDVLHFAFDPTFNRFGCSPLYLGGLEMQAFMEDSGYDLDDIARVVCENKKRAIRSILAPYGGIVNEKQVLDSREVASPLTELMIAKPADGAVVAVLASDDLDLPYKTEPIYIAGVGWGSGTQSLERRDLGYSKGTEVAIDLAMKEAQIDDIRDEIDAFFISDILAYRQLMHMEAMGLHCDFLPVVNPDGGSIGTGDLYEANGGVRLYEAVRQLRGEAGGNQLENIERVLVHGWRGLPTDTCAVAILERR